MQIILTNPRRHVVSRRGVSRLAIAPVGQSLPMFNVAQGYAGRPEAPAWSDVAAGAERRKVEHGRVLVCVLVSPRFGFIEGVQNTPGGRELPGNCYQEGQRRGGFNGLWNR
jgi:hypothetical protein